MQQADTDVKSALPFQNAYIYNAQCRVCFVCSQFIMSFDMDQMSEDLLDSPVYSEASPPLDLENADVLVSPVYSEASPLLNLENGDEDWPEYFPVPNSPPVHARCAACARAGFFSVLCLYLCCV